MNDHPRDARPRILVVDDNAAIHNDFRKILCQSDEGQGLRDLETTLFGRSDTTSQSLNCYDLDSAYGGEEAVEMVRTAVNAGHQYALAVVDMRMPPGWDGLKTIEHIWEVDPDVQVVICTAYSDHSWHDIVERLASQDKWLILRKPCDTAEVSQLALALTRKWQLHRQAQAHLRDLEQLVEERTKDLRRQIEDRKRAEEALREREARLHAIVDTAPDGIIIFDDRGVIDSVNAAAASIFGCSPQEMCGHCMCEFLPGSSDCEQGESLRLRLCAGTPDVAPKPIEVDVARKDGATVPVQLTTSEFTSGGRRLLTAIVRDLTEQRQLQCELSQAQKLESVGQLAAGIAHEINTPIQYVGDNTRFTLESLEAIKSVLDAYVEVGDAVGSDANLVELAAAAKKKAEDAELGYLLEEVPRAIEQSLVGIGQVSKIVRAMKEFTHPGSGHDKVCVDLAEMLQTTLTVSRNELKYVADVETDFDPDMPPVPCLPGELNQVFLNLIVNSAHAIRESVADGQRERGLITIRTRRDGPWAQIVVGDTGCGIDESIRDRVFDPFFTTKDVGQGTGQGLAITRSVVVDKHGGTIDFESAVGQGTEFTVRIPLAGIPAADRSAAALCAV